MAQRSADGGIGSDKNGTKIRKRHLVWRITPDAPQGKYFDADQPARESAKPTVDVPVDDDAQREPGWLQSSFELAHGLDVTDDPDTVPAALFDELFPKKSPR